MKGRINFLRKLTLEFQTFKRIFIYRWVVDTWIQIQLSTETHLGGPRHHCEPRRVQPLAPQSVGPGVSLAAPSARLADRRVFAYRLPVTIVGIGGSRSLPIRSAWWVEGVFHVLMRCWYFLCGPASPETPASRRKHQHCQGRRLGNSGIGASTWAARLAKVRARYRSQLAWRTGQGRRRRWDAMLSFKWTEVFSRHGERDSMTHSSYEITGRILSALKHWFHSRMRECVRCIQCENAVTPWASHCPTCGQKNPARVSGSAGIYLAIGSGLLTLGLLALFSR